MATIEVHDSARVTREGLERIGWEMAQFAEPFDESAFNAVGTPPSVERESFNEQGVSAVLHNYSVDEMRVNEQRSIPFAPDVFDTLIPAGASSWSAGFYAWSNYKTYGYQHAYIKLDYWGQDIVGLTAYAEPEDRAVAVMKAARNILREYPPTTTPASASGFRIFIAFGGGRAWEVVRDYLRRADIEVDAFTEVERAGQVTLDVVSEMVHSASMAVIVMTAADEMLDGTKRARQNVIHEAGFAQGALGTRNTIILLEDGVEPPSNIAGVTYIPFAPGEVHTTEERVVSLIRSRISAA